jgi:DNA repair protein RAD5
MSLLAQWQSEAEKASKEGTLKGMVYHGSEKAVNLQKFCAASNGANAPNAIITSYGTILSEYNQVVAQDDNRGSHSGIFSLDYFRIILDEVHFIKNRQYKTAKACYELSVKHHWVLTGTPIVNRLKDSSVWCDYSRSNHGATSRSGKLSLQCRLSLATSSML